MRLAACAANRSDDVVARHLIAARHDAARTLGGEAPRRGPADALRRACDEGDLAVQPIVLRATLCATNLDG